MSFSLRKNNDTTYIFQNSSTTPSQNIVTINSSVNRGTLLTANEVVYPNGYNLDVSGTCRFNYIYDNTDYCGNNGQILSNFGQVDPKLTWTYQGSNYRGSDMFPENSVFYALNPGGTGDFKNGPGTLAPNGLVYFSPLNNNFLGSNSYIFIWNPYTNLRAWAIVGYQSDKQAFAGGSITAPNSSMYFLPYGQVGNNEGFDSDASGILVVNPYKKTGNLYNLVDNTAGLPPCSPLNITADITMQDLSSEGGLGWRGLCYRYILQPTSPNAVVNDPAFAKNTIYGIPYNSSNILKINWFNNTTNLTDLSNINVATYPQIGTDISKWYGGVLAPNGNIYCIPNNARCILRITPNLTTPDTVNLDISNIDISNYTFLASNSNKWRGGALAPNGKIYCAPYGVTQVLVINPKTNTISFDISGFVGSYTGAILAPNGKIYCAPTNGTNALVINPEDNTWEYVSLGSTALRSFGPILTPQGQVAISINNDNNSDLMPIIRTGLPKYPLWMLAPEFNHV